MADRRLIEEFPVGHGHLVSVHEYTDAQCVTVRLQTVDTEPSGLTIGLDTDGSTVEALRKAGAALHAAARKIDERIIQLETLEGR